MYLDMGWCVYPAHSINPKNNLCSCGRSDCPCPGKHPVGRWIEFQNRLPTKREVQLWFSSMECNVGTVTGRVSGIVVVDADGKTGIENVRKLGLEPTLTARTGGGGRHYFYLYRYPTATKAKIIDGVDIRGDGGYVVLPPSLHRSGNHYEWLSPRALAVFDPKPFEAHRRENGNGNGNGNGLYTGTDLKWSEDLLQGVEEGSRSNSAARLAGRYFRKGLSMEEVWILMTTWNQRNTPPLEEPDLFRTVDAVRRKHEEVTGAIQINTVNELFRVINNQKE